MNVVAYARYSSDNQREESLTAQLRAIRDFAEKNQHYIINEYLDAARSGRTDQRPEFQRMISDAKKQTFQAILVYDLTRFSRDRYDSIVYKRFLKKRGVRVISVTNPTDASAEAEMLEGIMETVSEYESKKNAERVAYGLKENALQCKNTGGFPPLGYDLDQDKHYIINESEAAAVKMIFEMYASGSSYTEILNRLNLHGYKSKKGSKFGKNSLHDIICNEKYTGVFIYCQNKTTGRTNRGTSSQGDNIIKMEGGVPAIVDKDTFDKVQERMSAHRHGANSARRVYILSGLIYCNECGGAMSGHVSKAGKNKIEKVYYECSTKKRKGDCSARSILKDEAETAVFEALDQALFSIEAFDRIFSTYDSVQNRENKIIPNDIKEMQKQLNEVDKKIGNLVQAIANMGLSDSLKEELLYAEEQKASLKQRIAIAEELKTVYALDKKTIEQRYEEIIGQYRDIRTREPAQQKDIIKRFIRRVTVYPDKVDVEVEGEPERR